MTLMEWNRLKQTYYLSVEVFRKNLLVSISRFDWLNQRPVLDYTTYCFRFRCFITSWFSVGFLDSGSPSTVYLYIGVQLVCRFLRGYGAPSIVCRHFFFMPGRWTLVLTAIDVFILFPDRRVLAAYNDKSWYLTGYALIMDTHDSLN